MRISDWSSDVCSSDLKIHGLQRYPSVIHQDLTARAALVGKSGSLGPPLQLPHARTGPATPRDDPQLDTVERLARKGLSRRHLVGLGVPARALQAALARCAGRRHRPSPPPRGSPAPPRDAPPECARARKSTRLKPS